MIVRVFHQLNKSLKGWHKNEKYLKLDLLEEYSYPEPLPKDIFGDLHADSDQAYVMLATPGTGRSRFRFDWHKEIRVKLECHSNKNSH